MYNEGMNVSEVEVKKNSRKRNGRAILNNVQKIIVNPRSDEDKRAHRDEKKA